MTYRRIACLSTEVVETLYLIGAESRIAGISGFTVYPARARKEKPKISGFSTAHVERILAVDPDLVMAFSDLQADVVAELIRAGREVHVFNQRDVAGILRMIRSVAALVGEARAGERLIEELQQMIGDARARVPEGAARPLAYFEEWDDPLICGIGWVSELIDVAGGTDCFAERAHSSRALGRRLDPVEVVRAAPEVIIASWCGKKVRRERIAARAGWSDIPAVRDGRMHEIKSADILAPGPAAITRGLPQLVEIIAAARAALMKSDP